MKTILMLVLSAGLAAAPFCAPAHAQRVRANVSNPRVTVIVIKDQVGIDDETQQVPRTYRYPSAETVARAQDEIRSSAYLRSILQKKNVQLRNVVGVQTAFNGGKIVYVR